MASVYLGEACKPRVDPGSGFCVVRYVLVEAHGLFHHGLDEVTNERRLLVELTNERRVLPG